MENLKKTLASGAELEATLASFAEGHRLYKAVSREIENLDLTNDTVQKVMLRISSSEEIEKALWPCMGRATYNTLKINPTLFEDADIRGDFMEVAREVLGFNLLPFSKGVGSLLLAILKKGTDIQK